MKFVHDPEGARLPVKIDSTSNGEFAPVPLQPGGIVEIGKIKLRVTGG